MPSVSRSQPLFVASDGVNRAAFAPLDWSLFLGIALIWGSSFLFIAIGLEAVPAGVVTLARVGLGALTLALLPVERLQLDPEDRPRLVLLSVLWVAVPFTLFPLAQKSINSAVTGLLNGATPIFAALVAAILLRRAPRGLQLVGIAVGFVGIVAISLPTIGEGTNALTGALLVLAATLCYGFALNLAGPLQQRYGSVPVMARTLALATVWVMPFGLWQMREVRFDPGAWASVVVLGVVGTGLAFWVMASLVGRVGSTRASFITYLIPVVALSLGVAFRGDVVAPLAIVGVVLVLIGAGLASRADA